MGSIFSFSISSSIILALLYLAYRWTMANERQFNLNRVTLYLLYIFSLLSPLAYDFSSRLFSHKSDTLATVDINLTEISTGMIFEDKLIWAIILLWLYLGGVIFTTIRFCWSILKIVIIIKQGKRLATPGAPHLIISDRKGLSPFSFMMYIVIPKEDLQSSFSTILLHEQTHLRNQHWIDLIIANLVAIFQWYNPAAWLMIEEFKTLHEYQADDSVIRSGTDIKKYQYLLIEKAVGERLPSPANSLNHSKLKKRVTMMYKSKPRTMRRVAALATIPALFAGITLVNTPAVASVLSETKSASIFSNTSSQAADVETFGETREYIAETADKVTTFSEKPEAKAAEKMNGDEAFVAVQKMAEYPGGTGELMKFLSSNIKYPENAFKNDIQGRVIVKFIIAKNGKVESPTVVRGVDPELDAEAIRVIKEMPAWIPAENNGKPVASWFNLPVTFKLQHDEDENVKTE